MEKKQTFAQYYASIALLSSLLADRAAKEIRNVSKTEIMNAQDDVVQALTMIQLAKHQLANFEGEVQKIGLSPEKQNQTIINKALQELQTLIMPDIDIARDKPIMDLVVQSLRYISGLYLVLFFQILTTTDEADKIYISLVVTLLNDAQNSLSQIVIPYLYDFYMI